MSLQIAPLGPHESAVFAGVWIPWLHSTGRLLEPEDSVIMADPAAYYRATGGEAFLATVDGQPAGTVAVKGLGADGFEFCKLVVSDLARGRGAGRALVRTCIDFAEARGGPALYLQSFRALDLALGLYARMGFTDCPPPPGMTVLARTEVIMAKAASQPG